MYNIMVDLQVDDIQNKQFKRQTPVKLCLPEGRKRKR